MDYQTLLIFFEKYLPLFSGVIVALLSGFIAWLNLQYSLKNQFKQQTEREVLKETKEMIIALNSVYKEIQFNLINLNGLEKLMKKQGVNFLNFQDSLFQGSLKMDKWNKHSDLLEIANLAYLSKLQSFYFNLNVEITNNITNEERISKLITQGFELSESLQLTLENDYGHITKSGKEQFQLTP